MKKVFYIQMLAVFCAMTFAPMPAMAKAVTLTYSSFFPPVHVQAVTAEAWCKEVEKRTDKRVKVHFFPGQTLTRAPQTYETITDGIADIGTAALAYTQGRFPVMAAMDLPFGYKSGVAATKVANQLFEKMTPKEFAATQVMYFNAHGPGFIHTRKKAIEKLEDIKGQRIRSTGMSASVISALGGTPVSMAMPDTYQSLQRGVVDGSIHPQETNKGWNLGEVVDFMTVAYPAAYTTTFYVVVNKSKWNKIEAGDRAIIEAINAEWALKHGQAWDRSDEEGLALFQAKGGKAIELDEAENGKWAAALAPVMEDYAKQLDGMGVDGKGVLDFIRSALAALDK
jgi:TRAP-type C4-dicarboxylate transport system substrate-binding protein